MGERARSTKSNEVEVVESLNLTTAEAKLTPAHISALFVEALFTDMIVAPTNIRTKSFGILITVVRGTGQLRRGAMQRCTTEAPNEF